MLDPTLIQSPHTKVSKAGLNDAGRKALLLDSLVEKLSTAFYSKNIEVRTFTVLNHVTTATRCKLRSKGGKASRIELVCGDRDMRNRFPSGLKVFHGQKKESKVSRQIFKESFDRHRELLVLTAASCEAHMQNLCELASHALASGKRIYFFGNGGSAADAQHIATELSIRFIKNRKALAGMALTTDSSVLTACGNDLGFDQIFSRQIEAFGQPGDIALGISTSGNSGNVIAALETAKTLGMTAAAFAGGDGGKLKTVANPLVIVPSKETARIQEMHILLGHILCAEIEESLGLA